MKSFSRKLRDMLGHERNDRWVEEETFTYPTKFPTLPPMSTIPMVKLTTGKTESSPEVQRTKRLAASDLHILSHTSPEMVNRLYANRVSYEGHVDYDWLRDNCSNNYCYFENVGNVYGFASEDDMVLFIAKYQGV